MYLSKYNICLTKSPNSLHEAQVQLQNSGLELPMLVLQTRIYRMGKQLHASTTSANV
jgi:hypothetical protein